MKSVFDDSINTSSVSKLVIEKIKEAIENGELKSGDTLPSEAELMKSLGVSKSSIREAIKMLEAIGVAEIKRGSGTILSGNPNAGYANVLLFHMIMQQGTNDEFIRFRRMFEFAYSMECMNYATNEDLEEIKKSIDVFESHVNEGLVDVKDDIAFHEKILEATHNCFIVSLGKAINFLFEKYISYSINISPKIAVQTHKDIYEAILNKDLEKLKTSINYSMDKWRESLK